MKLARLATCFAVACTFSLPSTAALITFDFIGPDLVTPSLVASDTTGNYSLTATGIDYTTGDANQYYDFDVTQSAFGLGVRASAQNYSDNSNGFETAGPNDRLRLDLGPNTFTLVALDVYLEGNHTSNLQILLDGIGDPTTDLSPTMVVGAQTLNVNLVSNTFDFRKAGIYGAYLTSVTFETGEPLPTRVPAPAPLGLLCFGLAGCLLRRR